MSAVTDRMGMADLAPVRRLRRTRPPRLRLLVDPGTAAARRGRAIGRGLFVSVVGALVLVGMALLLILNTTLAQGAFDLQQLRAEYDGLQVQEQALAQQVATAQSPEALKAEAVRLGMVPVQVPAFLRLADGAVLGEPTPAKARASRRGKLARGATVGAVGTGDAATPDTPSGTAATGSDAAGTGGGTAVAAPPQSDGAEAAEDAAARDGRGDRRRDRAADDGAVAGPEGAEDQAAPTGPGTARG